MLPNIVHECKYSTHCISNLYLYTSVIINCGIQPTDVVTMAMEMLHNTCNMCICDFPDMNVLGLWQIPYAHVITITCSYD